MYTITDSNMQWKDLENDHDTQLIIINTIKFRTFSKPVELALTPEISNDPEKMSSSKCYDIEARGNV